MAEDMKLQRLERQLSRYGLGPLGDITNEVLHAAASIIGRLAASLRQAAFDYPLTTLVLSCEVGYVVARWRRKHARR